MPTHQNLRIPILSCIAAAGAAGFGKLTVLESNRRLARADRTAMRAIAQPLAKHKQAAQALHPLGKWWSYVPAAAVASAAIYTKGEGRPFRRRAGAAAPLLAAVASALANPLFDKLLPQPPMPPARRADPKPSFPSGHAFGLGAVSIATAYVFRREEIIGPAAVLPLMLLPPLVGGAAKIVEKKHWPSEVVGGLLVAITLASLSVMVYEFERGTDAN